MTGVAYAAGDRVIYHAGAFEVTEKAATIIEHVGSEMLSGAMYDVYRIELEDTGDVITCREHRLRHVPEGTEQCAWGHMLSHYGTGRCVKCLCVIMPPKAEVAHV